MVSNYSSTQQYYFRYYALRIINGVNENDVDIHEQKTLKSLEKFLKLGLWESSYLMLIDLEEIFKKTQYSLCKDEIKALIK